MPSLEHDAPRCPVVHDQPFNPFSVDPFPWLKAAQEEAPIFYSPESNMWWITRYSDVKQVLGDPITYSSEKVVDVSQLDPAVMDSFPDGHPLNTSLVNLDPPHHSRVRKLAQKAFTPKLINEREAEVRELCDGLVDKFIDDGRADIVSQFSAKLPTTVILKIMGVPLERVDQFIAWDTNIPPLVTGGQPLPPDQRRELSESVAAANVWLYEFVEDRQRNPQDDVTSMLIHAAGDDGEPALIRAEVVSMINIVITAGAATTKMFIPLMLRTLLTQPDQWEAVQADRSLLKRAVEEGLRVNNSVHGVNRTVTKDTELGGVRLAKGATVFVHLATAQRDERMFEDPDRFDVMRENVQKNVGFGYGIHTCLGAPLARLEARVALDCLMDRLPGLRMVPDQDLGQIPHFIGVLFQRFPVEWDVPGRDLTGATIGRSDRSQQLVAPHTGQAAMNAEELDVAR